MRSICIFSVKGGVGKTTLTANLGTALAREFNKRVILLDGNISDATLALHMGVNNFNMTLNDVVIHNLDILKAVYMTDHGVRVIPASLSVKKIDLAEIKPFLKDLQDEYDFFLIDAAPSLGRDARVAISLANEVLIITTPDLPSLTGCVRAVNVAKQEGKRIDGIVLNRVCKKRGEVTKDEVESITDVKVISIIPEDPNISLSISVQKPIVLGNSRAAVAFKELAAYLTGEEYVKGFWNKLKMLFSLKKLKIPKKIPAQLTELKAELNKKEAKEKSQSQKEKREERKPQNGKPQEVEKLIEG